MQIAQAFRQRVPINTEIIGKVKRARYCKKQLAVSFEPIRKLPAFVELIGPIAELDD